MTPIKRIIDLYGEQVFTARFVHEMISAQDERIDRANRNAAIAFFAALAACVTVIVILL